MPFWNTYDENRPPIRLRQVGPRKFQVLTAFRYQDPTNNKMHRIPKHDEDAAPEPGNSTDLASIPFPLWGLIASYGHQTLPALLHDHLCGLARRTAEAGRRKEAFTERREADRILRVALREEETPWLRAWMMWAGVSFGAYLDFARLRFALLCLQLLASFALIYSGLLSILGWRLPVPAAAAALWEQSAHLPLVGSWVAGLVGLWGWQLALPAVAALLWGSACRIPLLGSYIGVLIVPPLVLMAVLAGILWIPAALEVLWCRLRGEPRPLPTPGPYLLRPSLFP